ncbi:hypothetical protein [Streptomyces sp. NPDC054783]
MAPFGGSSAAELLDAVAERLGRPCAREERSGRVEREVVTATEGAGLPVPARDGDRSRLGPKSLGPAVRFAVGHAPGAAGAAGTGHPGAGHDRAATAAPALSQRR